MNSSTYSDLREQLAFQIENNNNNELAYFTHYMQTSKNGVAKFYKDGATDYLVNNHGLKINELPDLQWDVPFPPTINPTFSFIDLFAGIGGFRLAFQKAGGKCVFTSEWDYYAKKTYEANFGEVPFGDIRTFTGPLIRNSKLKRMIPDHDILCGGFPCQPFSLAGVSKKNSLGKQHGFLDETQGTLFFDIARIINAKRPKAFILENVKNLLSHDKKKTFKTIEKALIDLEYNLHIRVLDGKYYVPQHRERILIVGFDNRRFHAKETFEFPTYRSQSHTVGQILQKQVEDKFTLSDKLWSYLKKYAEKHKALGNGFGFGLANLDGITRTLSARYYKDGAEILIPQNEKNPRRLTPRECARLQGYPDSFVIPVSDNQAYKQFGNSIVVPLMEAVAKNVENTLRTYEHG